MSEINYPELEEMIDELDNIESKEKDANCKRIKVLQEIGEKLINNYKISIHCRRKSHRYC